MNADFPKMLFFKGGGGGGGSAAPTVASSPPPPTQTALDVQQARRDTLKQAGKKKGVPATVLAGETGGYKNPFTAPATGDQKKTLLGGF